MQLHKGNEGNSKKTKGSVRGNLFSRWSKPKSQKAIVSSAVIVQQGSISEMKTYAKNPNAYISEKKLDSELSFLRLKVIHQLQNSQITIPVGDHVKWEQLEKYNSNLADSRQDVERFRNKTFKPSSLDAFAERLVTSVRKNHAFLPENTTEHIVS